MLSELPPRSAAHGEEVSGKNTEAGASAQAGGKCRRLACGAREEQFAITPGLRRGATV